MYLKFEQFIRSYRKARIAVRYRPRDNSRVNFRSCRDFGVSWSRFTGFVDHSANGGKKTRTLCLSSHIQARMEK